MGEKGGALYPVLVLRTRLRRREREAPTNTQMTGRAAPSEEEKDGGEGWRRASRGVSLDCRKKLVNR